MTEDLVVVRETVDLASVEVDVKIVIVLYAVLVCWCFGTLSIKISATDQTTIDVVVS